MLSKALALAAEGFHVFPIEEGVKFPPRIDGFPTKASRDPDQIRRWWTCPVLGFEQNFNIGISTSRFGDDETLLVVDIDNKGDKHGNETILALVLSGKLFPDTRETITPSGGRHIIYRTPAAVWQSVGKLGEGVDIRAFGGYVVGPGSVVGEGEYIRAGAQEIAAAPEWLVEFCGLRGTDHPPAAQLPLREQHEALSPERARRRGRAHLDALPEAVAGERNHAAFRVANKMKDTGVPEEDCLALMREHWRCTPPLDDAELSVAIGSAYKSTRTAFGSAAPEVQFSVVPPLKRTLFRRLLDFCIVR